jgi:RimJ/RimL family protein N-acetyltransferase
MSPMSDLQTDRLILRRWRPSDRALFAQMNADPRVMEHFPNPLTLAQTDDLIALIQAHFARHNFGPWAAELRSTGAFIGFIGLNIPTFEPPFTPHTNPCVEIGWRLAHAHWGQGFATEGASALLHHAFTVLNLEEVVSFTVPANQRSRRVMEKLGMQHDPTSDFDHPLLPAAHPLRRHVLYRLRASSL